MDPSDRQSDWINAFEQARSLVAAWGLDEVLHLPPSKLVAGLSAWRHSHSG